MSKFKFTIHVKNNISIDGWGSLQISWGYTREASLEKRRKKTCLCKRYAFVGNISFAKPPILIIITSINWVKIFEDVISKKQKFQNALYHWFLKNTDKIFNISWKLMRSLINTSSGIIRVHGVIWIFGYWKTMRRLNFWWLHLSWRVTETCF